MGIFNTLFPAHKCGENARWNLKNGTLYITGKGSISTLGSGKCLWPDNVRLQIVNVIIGNKIDRIGQYAFCSCENLVSVTIPDSVTSIGSYAFVGCSSLKTIVIPDSVVHVGNYAFKGCESLEKVFIPNSVTTIGFNSFSGLSNIKEITVPDNKPLDFDDSEPFDVKSPAFLKAVRGNAVKLPEYISKCS